MGDKPITELLGKTHGPVRNAPAVEAARADLYGYYLDKARSLAADRMSSALRRRRRPSSIAHEALASCLENAETSEAPLASRVEFERYLRNHIKQKVADAAQHEQAQRRDMRREESAEEVVDPEYRQLRPDEKAIADELAIASVRILLEEPDEVRRVIAMLHLLGGFSAAQIQEMIRPLVTESESGELPPGYSLSSIRLGINKQKEAIKSRLEQR